MRRQTLRRWAERGLLARPYPRLFVRAEYWDGLDLFERGRHILRSLSRLHPGWVFCGMSAALMFRLNDSTRHLARIEVATSADSHGQDRGMLRHRYVRSPRPCSVDGVTVTSLERTVFDCARNYTLPDGMAVVEAALRQRLSPKSELDQAFRELPGTKRAQALSILRHADGLTENGGEAYAYGVMLDEGLAMPQVQQVFIDPFDSTRTLRPDFTWTLDDGRLVFAELDGRQKYMDPAMFRDGSLAKTIIAEKEREERLRVICSDMVRFSFAEAFGRTNLVRKLLSVGIPRLAD